MSRTIRVDRVGVTHGRVRSVSKPTEGQSVSVLQRRLPRRLRTKVHRRDSEDARTNRCEKTAAAWPLNRLELRAPLIATLLQPSGSHRRRDAAGSGLCSSCPSPALAFAADDSKVEAATEQLKSGAREIGNGKIGTGVEDTAKGIGSRHTRRCPSSSSRPLHQGPIGRPGPPPTKVRPDGSGSVFSRAPALHRRQDACPGSTAHV